MTKNSIKLNFNRKFQTVVKLNERLFIDKSLIGKSFNIKIPDQRIFRFSFPNIIENNVFKPKGFQDIRDIDENFRWGSLYTKIQDEEIYQIHAIVVQFVEIFYSLDKFEMRKEYSEIIKDFFLRIGIETRRAIHLGSDKSIFEPTLIFWSIKNKKSEYVPRYYQLTGIVLDNSNGILNHSIMLKIKKNIELGKNIDFAKRTFIESQYLMSNHQVNRGLIELAIAAEYNLTSRIKSYLVLKKYNSAEIKKILDRYKTLGNRIELYNLLKLNPEVTREMSKLTGVRNEIMHGEITEKLESSNEYLQLANKWVDLIYS